MDNSSHTNRFMASLMDGLKDGSTYNSMNPEQRLYVDSIRAHANEKIETLYDEMNFQAKEIARLRAEVEALRVEAELYKEDSERLAFVYSDAECATDDLLNIEFNMIQGIYPTIDEARAAIDAARGKDNG